MAEPISIIVVDDEDSIRRRCVRLLAKQGYDVVGEADSRQAIKMIRSNHYDLMLLDIRMPGIDGLELMKRVKTFNSSIEAIVMTAYASVDTAVKAIKLGAYDYLTKPFDSDELLNMVGHLADKLYSHREIQKLRLELEQQREYPRLVGSSPAIREVRQFIERVSNVDCIVSIYGESGTGKGLLAKLIHLNSNRSNQPFVVTDCASLSQSVLESELFGHVKGAFTGAHADRKGYFETAKGGTLFLDEIGEMPLKLQAKLLRAVQEKTISRLGEAVSKKVDVRIITATNRDLETMVKEREFRHDLYYRINVIKIKMPPLREHLEDIPALFDHLVKYYAARLNLPRVPANINRVLEAVGPNYSWPGNVRELENLVQRALILGEGSDDIASSRENQYQGDIQNDGDTIEVKIRLNPDLDYAELVKEATASFSRQFIERLLEENNGNISQTADKIGMRRTSLQRVIKRYEVKPNKFRS